MLSLEYSSLAEEDQRQIAIAIREENPAAAAKWIIELEETCRKLTAFPHIRRRRDDLRQGVHCFPYGNYLIFYKVTEAVLFVVRVVHGARNLPALFAAEEAE